MVVGSSPTVPAKQNNKLETVVKICKKHGEIDFVKRKDGHYRCKKCATEAVQRRREKLKELAIEYKGGKCQCCGYNKYKGALEFHHLNPEEKDFGIGERGYTRSFEKVKEELDKCILVCSNCHKEIHAGIISINDYIKDDKIEIVQ